MSVSSSNDHMNGLLRTATPLEHVAGYANSSLKRAFDFLVSGTALILLAPFFAVVAALVALGSKGPVFYGHVRVTRGGNSFRCWKFRTMVQDADAVLADMLRDPKLAEEWARNQKLKNDPRVNAIGEFLRRTSLDELPQLFNIFRGEMSFVGPRPVTQPELARYAERVSSYLSVRPGLTGPWQIGGRSDTCFNQRVALDHHYVKTAGFFSDIWIMLRTALVLFGDRNAA
jgi:lipopolysaccharide/colanic/teichoic acid biosynthesis glycosyltransferase